MCPDLAGHAAPACDQAPLCQRLGGHPISRILPKKFSSRWPERSSATFVFAGTSSPQAVLNGIASRALAGFQRPGVFQCAWILRNSSQISLLAALVARNPPHS